MNWFKGWVATCAFGLLASAAFAVNIDTVPVGNPGNAADTRYATPGYGAVGYTYNIGKYEVTAGQYTEFLNAVAATDTYALYSTYMSDTRYGSGISRSGSSGSYTYSVDAAFANRPVNNVSYWDACRFTNWLHNGQRGADTTETGAYTLNGYNDYDGRTIQRNAGWKWAVTSEDEWHKAAYYDPSKPGGAGYWDYPTRSNTAPSNALSATGTNNANYYNSGYTIGAPYYRTEVGAFAGSPSAYGTFDQGGNVKEWNEAIVFQDFNYAERGLRGGSYGCYDFDLRAWGRGFFGVPEGDASIGFRVVAVPEPGTLTLLAFGGLVLPRRRRGRC